MLVIQFFLRLYRRFKCLAVAHFSGSLHLIQVNLHIDLAINPSLLLIFHFIDI